MATTAQLEKRIEKLERTVKQLTANIYPDASLDAADRQAIRAANADERARRLVPLDEKDRTQKHHVHR